MNATPANVEQLSPTAHHPLHHPARRGDKAPALSSSSSTHPSIASLQQQIWQIEGNTRPDDPARISAGHPGLDQLLPEGGYLPGTLVEFISESPGDAAGWLSLRLVVEALRRGGAAVLVDPAGELYAPALVSLGVPLERLVLVQGESGGRGGCGDAGWAFDLALRCPGVAAVWGALPTTDSRWLRRWQLAAEAGGSLGVLLRPATVLARPTWSAIQWHVLPGTDANPTHKKTLPSPRCLERGEGLGVRGPCGFGCQTPASGSIETGSGANFQPPPGGLRRSATKEPAASAVPLKDGAVAASLPDWEFRLRLTRACRGVGSETGLRINTASGRLEVMESPGRQLGPIAPPPGRNFRRTLRSRGAVA